MITYGQLSDIGRIRKSNEDAVYSQVISGGGAYSQSDIGLFIVVDGMGGSTDARLAAEIVIQSIAKKLSRILILPLVDNYDSLSDKYIEETLRSAFSEANQAVCKQTHYGGATTTLAFICGNKLFLAHIGDTAAFLIDKNTKRRLTKMHTFVEALLELGYLSPEEAELGDNRVYRCIGQSSDAINVDISKHDFPQHSILLLCSDWLYKIQSESEILAIIDNSYHPQDACQRLVDATNARGGHDNVSVILVSNQFPFKSI